MQICFLTGPAGSGKTFRCLAEIRDALRASAEGPPLVLLAPKQATFQLERQLLADPAGAGLQGYTRLHILSFERLAYFIFDQLQKTPPEILDEEGRLMVLRSLLTKKRDELKLFRASARLTGFAQQLSLVLRELQRNQLTPDSLTKLSNGVRDNEGLSLKLHDLAALLQHYLDWLKTRDLQDANDWLDAATAMLAESAKPQVSSVEPTAESKTRSRKSSNDHFGLRTSDFVLGALWLDGFAELSPQELGLLAAIVPHCEQATLAFCLDHVPAGKNSWLSHWSVVRRTFEECKKRLENLPGARISVELLPRNPNASRFSSPVLRHLEANWSQTTSDPASRILHPASDIRIIACENPDAEAVFAAREILRFVRAGGRFRDTAVLLRTLEGYHEPLQRIFARYQIPFFLDRRESVAHHPLAEITRSALRTVAFDWAHDDWFAALKTGLVPVDETEIDRLENEALARGWRGRVWRQPFPETELASAEKIRKRIVPPFQKLALQTAAQQNRPTGPQLAEALREFWRALNIEEQLRQWADTLQKSPQAPGAGRRAPIHTTVWEQMNAWLDNLERAFPDDALAVREWLPILEAGLANLTVGVIPPALDQVLIGAIDRSRNPDLKFALLLGMNESVFPAAPDAPVILTDADRDELCKRGASIGPNLRERMARERYYGYIACTRASEKLALTYSRQNANGKALNPSPFVAHLRRIFPELAVGEFHAAQDWREAEHVSELAPLLVGTRNSKLEPKNFSELLRLPALARLNESLQQLQNPDPNERLSPELAKALYGKILRSSVSRLEEFAECPFRFFVHSGLRADERKVFELDARERGTFQHDVLKTFHEELAGEGKRWRDITPQEARERVGKIAQSLAASFRDGLMRDSAQARFAARMLASSLQDFVEVLVSWMRGQYEFDPVAVELEFGKAESAPCELDLGDGRSLALQGRIDRVDLCHKAGVGALCVVMDYKSGQKSLDPVLVHHGVQLQLLAYLNVLRRWPNPQSLGASRLLPAGVFYVNLRGRYESGKSRADALAQIAEVKKLAYQHTGRFDAGALEHLDKIRAADQFNYRLKKDGTPYANSAEALTKTGFEKLLDRVDTLLVEMGRSIYAGEAEVNPYRKGKKTPCEFCDYRSICRIDPWTHQYRALGKTEESDEAD